jgi:hypothetical protein
MKRFTPATVIAMVALFVALAGSATAAGTVLITGKQIKNGSVGLVDLSASAKRALKGARGPAGDAGAQGIPGPAGAPGVAGPAGGFDPAKVSYVEGATVTLAPQAAGSGSAVCPAGAKAISGGWVVLSGDVGEVFGSRSFDSGGSWTVSVFNWSQYTDATVAPFAVCAAR